MEFEISEKSMSMRKQAKRRLLGKAYPGNQEIYKFHADPLFVGFILEKLNNFSNTPLQHVATVRCLWFLTNQSILDFQTRLLLKDINLTHYWVFPVQIK